jgi:equilibrative nucleoside transporter 1/2/3
VIWSQHKVLIISLARVIFIPLFMMCNIAGSVNPIISSDWLFMLILLACGLSCGYVSTMCIMSAASLEHNPRLKGKKEDVDVAATVASFFLVGGLAVGALMSFAVRFAYCRCNPFVD